MQLWAFDFSAFGLIALSPNIETEKPVSTVVCCEGPFSLPDFKLGADFT